MQVKQQSRLSVWAMAIGLVVSITMPATDAFALKPGVRKACAGDYQSFCAQYLPDSAEARRCFESNRKQLTKPCITALIDAGEVPAKYLKR